MLLSSWSLEKLEQYLLAKASSHCYLLSGALTKLHNTAREVSALSATQNSKANGCSLATHAAICHLHNLFKLCNVNHTA